MRIIVDIMSGDKAPLEILLGVDIASKQEFSKGIEYTLVGDENVINSLAKENGIDLSAYNIVHTDVVLTMEDDPMAIMKEKKNSSMGLGLQLLSKGEGDAFVSAGNTGALFSGSSLIVKRVPGIQRAGIGTYLPFANPVLLLDSGASVRPNEEYMVGFAVMGNAYMKALYGIERPRVGLLNNGTEEHKGTELQQAAYHLLGKSKLFDFVGNVEGNSLILGGCDVCVTDGFTGNVTLKVVEGMGKLLSGELKAMFGNGLGGAVAYLLVKKKLKEFKKRFDAKEHGGAPILGLRKTVIKAHGSSDAMAISNAVRQAINCVNRGVVDIIAAEAEKLNAEKAEMAATESVAE